MPKGNKTFVQLALYLNPFFSLLTSVKQFSLGLIVRFKTVAFLGEAKSHIGFLTEGLSSIVH